jgi:transcriptional regulator with XRE-family HTH domain
MSKSTLADAIRKTRDRSGLSQADFAARLKTQRAAIARWESGKAKPSILALVRLAELAKNTEEEAPILAALGGLVGGMDPSRVARSLFPNIEMHEMMSSLASVVHAHGGDLIKAGPLLTVVALIVARCGKIDRSIVEILSLWLNYWDKPAALKHFQDAEAYLRVQLERDAAKRADPPLER